MGLRYNIIAIPRASTATLPAAVVSEPRERSAVMKAEDPDVEASSVPDVPLGPDDPEVEEEGADEELWLPSPEVAPVELPTRPTP